MKCPVKGKTSLSNTTFFYNQNKRQDEVLFFPLIDATKQTAFIEIAFD